MEHWHQASIPPVNAEDEELSCSSRILTDTSGNVRADALDTKEGIENKDPASNTALERVEAKSAPSQYPSQVPAPSHHQENLHYLNARRQRHGSGLRNGRRPQEDAPRPYLTCKKYLAYRVRPRFDSGKDGAPVWDSVTEEAFQDGIQSFRNSDSG